MGSLTLPASGHVYVDSPIVIYTVQEHPVYAPMCLPLWEAAQAGRLKVISSDLTLLETLVRPLREEDIGLQRAFEEVLLHSEFGLRRITRRTLRSAAGLRAQIPGLRTPDAIHAATALEAGAALLVTNDPHFRRVPGLVVSVLDDPLA